MAHYEASSVGTNSPCSLMAAHSGSLKMLANRDGPKRGLRDDVLKAKAMSNVLSALSITPAKESLEEASKGGVGAPTDIERKSKSKGATTKKSSYIRIKDTENNEIKFEIGQHLGKGAFGTVFLARESTTGFVCALKRISKRRVLQKGPQALKNIQREIRIHSRLSRSNHSHFVSFYNYFHDNKAIYMAMEYAIGGELKEALEKHYSAYGRGFSERTVSKWMMQLASAVSYMHSMNITHRDIKPENILLGADMEIKLTDFGWSVRSSHSRKTLCGTPDYLAPELVAARTLSLSHGSQSASFDLSVDLWACGVLAFELLVGDAPFSWTPSNRVSVSQDFAFHHPDDDMFEMQVLFNRILAIEIHWPGRDLIGRYARDFISNLLKKSPKRRMPVDRWKFHPWFRNMEGKGKKTSRRRHKESRENVATENLRYNRKFSF